MPTLTPAIAARLARQNQEPTGTGVFRVEPGSILLLNDIPGPDYDDLEDAVGVAKALDRFCPRDASDEWCIYELMSDGTWENQTR